MRVGVLFSGGKDSTYSLHWAYIKGLSVKCLITVEPSSSESWMLHYPNVQLTKLQSLALDVPQIYKRCMRKEVEKEVNLLKEAISEAIKLYRIEALVTGALLSDYQRMTIEMLCGDLGIPVLSPLWRRNQEDYLFELLEIGIKFIVTSITVMGLSPKLLGKVITRENVEEIVASSRKYKFNAAFEGGEAETLVVDSPLFTKRLEVKGRIVREGQYSWRYIISEARLVKK